MWKVKVEPHKKVQLNIVKVCKTAAKDIQIWPWIFLKLIAVEKQTSFITWNFCWKEKAVALLKSLEDKINAFPLQFLQMCLIFSWFI